MSKEKCASVGASSTVPQLQLLKYAIIIMSNTARQCRPAGKAFHVFQVTMLIYPLQPMHYQNWPILYFGTCHVHCDAVDFCTAATFVMHSRAISFTVSKLCFLDNRLTNSVLLCEASGIIIGARTTALVLPCLLNNACSQRFTLRGCTQFTSETSTRVKVNQNTHSSPNDPSQDENFYTCKLQPKTTTKKDPHMAFKSVVHTSFLQEQIFLMLTIASGTFSNDLGHKLNKQMAVAVKLQRIDFSPSKQVWAGCLNVALI